MKYSYYLNMFVLCHNRQPKNADEFSEWCRLCSLNDRSLSKGELLQGR
jgi:hypothetical protein